MPGGRELAQRYGGVVGRGEWCVCAASASASACRLVSPQMFQVPRCRWRAAAAARVVWWVPGPGLVLVPPTRRAAAKPNIHCDALHSTSLYFARVAR